MTRTEQAAALRAAAELVERGWRQWRPYDPDTPDGAVCVTEAIVRVVGPDAEYARSGLCCNLLAAYIGVENVSLWNDYGGRTAADVVAALRGCADELERGGGEEVAE